MPDQRAAGWVLPLAIATIAIAVAVLIIVPIVFILTGSSSPGGDSAAQTPVVTDETAITIAISDFTYSPANLTIDAGTEVTWINEDSAAHDATDRDGGWRTDLLSQQDREAVTFDTPGTFEYYCTIHPWMEGTITVR